MIFAARKWVVLVLVMNHTGTTLENQPWTIHVFAGNAGQNTATQNCLLDAHFECEKQEELKTIPI